MKKHNKIVMLARSKLNSIKTLSSKALSDYEISHKEYQTIINEEGNYRNMKENNRMMKSRKNDELNEEEERNKINKINKKMHDRKLSFFFFFFFLSTKIFKTTAETYGKNFVHKIKLHKKGNDSVLWVKIHDLQQQKLVLKTCLI